MSKSEYSDAKVQAVREVLREVLVVLAEYAENIVLVGGWCPALLIPDSDERHVGSLDIDLYLDHKPISAKKDPMISNLLTKAGFAQDPVRPSRRIKSIRIEGAAEPMQVHIDLLAGEYGGRKGKKQGGGHEHQNVQDLKAHMTRGGDLASIQPVEIVERYTDAAGTPREIKVRIASVGTLVCMKALAMQWREKKKNKDAYDIDFCLNNYPGGVEAVALDLSNLGDHGLVEEAMDCLRKHFSSTASQGPRDVADYRELPVGQERTERLQQSLQRVLELLERHSKLRSKPST